MNLRRGSMLLWVLIGWLAASSAVADAKSSRGGEPIEGELLDLPLVDQDGTSVRIAKDLVADRLAVITPFYTSCPSSYPFLIFMLSRLQHLLGDRLGREVVLVSITVDPELDTPMRLKAYAQDQGALPGWYFLTGKKADLGKVLAAIGALRSERVEEHDHIPITVVGSVRSGWRRYHGLPSPDFMLQEVQDALQRP